MSLQPGFDPEEQGGLCKSVNGRSGQTFISGRRDWYFAGAAGLPFPFVVQGLSLVLQVQESCGESRAVSAFVPVVIQHDRAPQDLQQTVSMPPLH